MASIDGRDPDSSFKNLNKELKLYSSELSRRTQIVVANKMDMPGAKELIKEFKPGKTKKVYRISALTGEGIEELLKAIASELKRQSDV